MRCVLKCFEENARRSIRIAAHALKNNGEVEHDSTGVLGEAGSAHVGLFRFASLTLAIDDRFDASPARVFLDSPG